MRKEICTFDCSSERSCQARRRVLSSAGVTEPCHTSHRRRHFQNKLSVLFVNNITFIYFHLKQNLSRTFVASCSVVPMDWVPALRCKHPFSCSAWRNALIGRCWEPAKCCLFTQLHQSKQTNKRRPTKRCGDLKKIHPQCSYSSFITEYMYDFLKDNSMIMC